ncbi:MAG TPA: hypothetical protein VGE25_09715 [Sediminibacterium sp.]|nr:hypothetical protein [Bacteroidota bacterium]
MANLGTTEKQLLETLFQMSGGGVLNFSNRMMEEFFRDDLGIQIYSEQYNYASGSKANRMRGFWKIAPDPLCAKALIKLIEYIESQIVIGNLDKSSFSPEIIASGRRIANQLLGVKQSAAAPITEDEFINKAFKDVDINKLGLDGVLTNTVTQRLEEIRKCLHAKSPLAVIFLCGSTLEGILLGIALKNIAAFNTATASPKDKTQKVKNIPEWTLNDLINVARELTLIGEDVKKYSHALRDFRNYIHPYQQSASGFHPDEHTAKISWAVLQAAISQLSK